MQLNQTELERMMLRWLARDLLAAAGYVADIDQEPPRYWKDGSEITAAQFVAEAPVSGYTVEIE